MIGAIASHYVGSGAAYSAEVLAEAPLEAYYRQGDLSGSTMTDSSGHGRHGTYSASPNNPTLGQPGALFSEADPAALFNGTTAFGNVPTAAWMNAWNAFTLEAWIKSTGTSGTIIGRSVVPSLYRLGMSAGKAFVEVNTTVGGTTLLLGTSAINDGLWHYLTGRWTGLTLAIDVDGVNENSVAKSGSITGTSSSALRVAQRANDSFFPGTVDEVAIYTANIGPTRVAAHYAAR